MILKSFTHSTETTNYHKGDVYLQKHPLQRQQIITKELSIFIQTPSTETTNYHKGVVYLQKHPLQRQQIITKELSIFKNTLYRDNKLSQRRCYNYQLCQDCFWRGRTSGNHSNDHDMKEYTTYVSQVLYV
jgi:hypothetical protein